MKKKEPSIEDRRADVVRRMVGPGARRIQLLAELEEVDRILRPLVIEATELNVTTRRIGELIGLTSSGVSRWARSSRS